MLSEKIKQTLFLRMLQHTLVEKQIRTKDKNFTANQDIFEELVHGFKQSVLKQNLGWYRSPLLLS